MNITNKLEKITKETAEKIKYLEHQLQVEKDHSNFLERLLETLYGDGWNELTLYEAAKWNKGFLLFKYSK